MAEEAKKESAAKAPAKKAAAKPATAKADTAAKKPAAKADATAKAPAKAPAKKAAAKPAAEKAETAAKKPAASKAAAAKSETAKKAAAKPATAKVEGEATAKAAAKKKPAAKSEEKSELPALKVHHLRPAPGARTAKTRVGRGEGGTRGKTAGRGTKGTKARNTVRDGFEGGQMPLQMRLPKLRGFKNPFRTEYQVVNLDKLNDLYPSGGDVTVEDLIAKGAVRKGHLVKVLGGGDLSVKLNVVVDSVSGSAREKILAAGGSISDN